MTRRALSTAAALLVLALVAAAYWPVLHAGLVWDDKTIFHDNAWLRYGDGWKDFIFHNFFDWSEYFRPLVVGLFVFEARGLDGASGAMHLVSLGLHLANTALVGLLARSVLKAFVPGAGRALFPALAMLVYGLHPALVEPVVWIACQADLLVTLFMLIGLLCNQLLVRGSTRAACVGLAFLAAACCKESAFPFPLLLLIVDWLCSDAQPAAGFGQRLRALWRRQKWVYLSVLAAGCAYLALRYWALGMMIHPAAREPLLSFARLQTASFLFITYWRLLLWPMRGLGPLHEIDTHPFAIASAGSLAIDLAALAIVAGAGYFALRRKPLACAVLAASVVLLPVLHVLPVRFEVSLYHERYAMTALALLCALWPAALAGAASPRLASPLLKGVACLLLAAWLGLALVNVRVTVPLWSDETKLWQWVLRDHPESVTARDHLLSTYMERGDYAAAQPLADALVAESAPCANCMINAASLALARGDAARASVALEKASGQHLQSQPRQLQGFVLATGQLRELKRDLAGAEEAYRDAITLEPFDPEAQMTLALLLAREKRESEARAACAQALALFVPEERERRRQVFERTLAAASQAGPDSPPPGGPDPGKK